VIAARPADLRKGVPSMTTLLEKISELDNIIASGSVERRVQALQHVTDAFLESGGPLSEEHTAFFDETFSRLISNVEVSARVQLAHRLADKDYAPEKTIRALACDEAIEVAAPVLAQSNCLAEATIIEIIRGRSQQYLLAISQRSSIGPAVTDELIAHGDRTVVHTTVLNAGATFSSSGFASLARKAVNDDELAESVGMRGDVPRYIFAELMNRASDIVRQRLEAAKPHLAEEIRKVLTDVSRAIEQKVGLDSADYDAVRAEIDLLRANGQLRASKIEEFAHHGKVEKAVVALAMLNGVPVEFVDRALFEERAELIIFIARAIDLPWAAVRALLMMNPRARRLTTTELDQHCLTATKLKAETAKQAIRFFLLKNAKPRRPSGK
jgi:uncharacterized protein (DUF2336 family)